MQLSAADKATLYRDLARLIGADFHADRAVALLAGQNPAPRKKAFLDGLERGLARRAGIAKALEEENSELVTGVEVALVSAGEASGRLAEAFEHLAHYFEAVDAGVREARGALVYPLVLAHLGIVLPEIPALFVDDGRGNPLASMAVKIGALWLLAFVGWRAWRGLSAAAVKSAPVDAWLGRVPLIGAVRRHWALARFAQVFHAGLLAAMNMARVTRLAGEAAQSGVLLRGTAAAAARIETGAPLASSLGASGAFPRMFVDSIAVAEEAGAVDKEMRRWAAVETGLAGEAMRRLVSWLPRIVYGTVALYIAWRIIAMFMGVYAPLFKLMEEA